jgi:hypothetical protein
LRGRMFHTLQEANNKHMPGLHQRRERVRATNGLQPPKRRW